MKVMVIAGGGNLGRRVVDEAMKRGHQVTAVVRKDIVFPAGVTILVKDLFQLERTDIEGMDVVISTFGGGFQSNPIINQQSFQKYIELLQHSGILLIVIGGEGSLYADETHTQYVYETPNHPEFLKEISKNVTIGIQKLEKAQGMNWVCMCPPKEFDVEKKSAGRYQISYERITPYDVNGNSYLAYCTMAKAMLDFTETATNLNSVVTINETK